PHRRRTRGGRPDFRTARHGASLRRPGETDGRGLEGPGLLPDQRQPGHGADGGGDLHWHRLPEPAADSGAGWRTPAFLRLRSSRAPPTCCQGSGGRVSRGPCARSRIAVVRDLERPAGPACVQIPRRATLLTPVFSERLIRCIDTAPEALRYFPALPDSWPRLRSRRPPLLR